MSKKVTTEDVDRMLSLLESRRGETSKRLTALEERVEKLGLTTANLHGRVFNLDEWKDKQKKDVMDILHWLKEIEKNVGAAIDSIAELRQEVEKKADKGWMRVSSMPSTGSSWVSDAFFTPAKTCGTCIYRQHQDKTMPQGCWRKYEGKEFYHVHKGMRACEKHEEAP